MGEAEDAGRAGRGREEPGQERRERAPGHRVRRSEHHRLGAEQEGQHRPLAEAEQLDQGSIEVRMDGTGDVEEVDVHPLAAGDTPTRVQEDRHS